jgi:hypothetical protein
VGDLVPHATLMRIRDWVAAGGILIVPREMEPRSPESAGSLSSLLADGKNGPVRGKVYRPTRAGDRMLAEVARYVVAQSRVPAGDGFPRGGYWIGADKGALWLSERHETIRLVNAHEDARSALGAG